MAPQASRRSSSKGLVNPGLIPQLDPDSENPAGEKLEDALEQKRMKILQDRQKKTNYVGEMHTDS